MQCGHGCAGPVVTCLGRIVERVVDEVVDAMREVGARRICFTDSIGSFGAEAPRVGATARCLLSHSRDTIRPDDTYRIRTVETRVSQFFYSRPR